MRDSNSAARRMINDVIARVSVRDGRCIGTNRTTAFVKTQSDTRHLRHAFHGGAKSAGRRAGNRGGGPGAPSMPARPTEARGSAWYAVLQKTD